MLVELHTLTESSFHHYLQRRSSRLLPVMDPLSNYMYLIQTSLVAHNINIQTVLEPLNTSEAPYTVRAAHISWNIVGL